LDILFYDRRVIVVPLDHRRRRHRGAVIATIKLQNMEK
jgi:hypothetical protein